MPEPGALTASEERIQRTVAEAVVSADRSIEALAIHDAITAVWSIVEELNGYITEQEPWALAKRGDRERLGTVLYTATEGLRALTVLLSPVVPRATTALWEALGVAESLGALTAQPLREAGRWGILPVGTAVGALAPLFPRIEAPAA